MNHVLGVLQPAALHVLLHDPDVSVADGTGREVLVVARQRCQRIGARSISS